MAFLIAAFTKMRVTIGILGARSHNPHDDQEKKIIGTT
jgi:hypothetical protein